ncbi:hypothetical protein HRI_003283500 [Hibiscus trionum]|uniref:Reverse transcriptase domain-containing protein n=1 Tax=Hibiscus trionum TaxID=183268 RepID=A0A9W7IJA1_HIBTR|nr:hypothetical protein HRI_003283500 [Hibiscus trionum]
MGINHSFITLIPKVPSPESLEEFRPISLIGGVYKILSKVLSKRLQEVMDSLIGETQFAFISGRQLLDCSLIANEVVDYLVKEKKQGVAFKIDFHKAFDSVEWSFLISIMKKCGFNEQWCKWIYNCISSVSISVLVNGAPTEAFGISRGLRQGCALSPLLFNLVGEALNQMIRKAVNHGLFSGIQVGRRDNHTMITNLQFADDLLIFVGASVTQVCNVKRVLRIFKLASGLKLNINKSKIYGINIDPNIISDRVTSIGCKLDSFPTKYLGLPLGACRNNGALWEPVVKAFESKLDGWKTNFISSTDRLVLIKSVLSSLPMFYLSLFIMPKSV